MVEFFEASTEISVANAGETIEVSIDGVEHSVSRAVAEALHDQIGDALTDRTEYFRTAGEFRSDGSYVVSRRGADSAGNAKVFESFDVLTRLYDRLPDEFTADTVGRTGITGSRRHMLVHHFAEHPSFECTVSSRNPLTVVKREEESVEVGPAVAD